MWRAYAPTDLRLPGLDINSDGRRPALLTREVANGRGESTVTIGPHADASSAIPIGDPEQHVPEHAASRYAD